MPLATDDTTEPVSEDIERSQGATQEAVIAASESAAASQQCIATFSQPLLPRPKPQKSRLYSQVSFHAMDFDCYDINDCYNYSNSNNAVSEGKAASSTTHSSVASTSNFHHNSAAVGSSKSLDDLSAKHQIIKSSSSNALVGDVQPLFQTNPLQHHLFRSSSSESIPLLTRQYSNPQQKIKLGICAMDKKAQSQPMKEILSRLDINGPLSFLRCTVAVP
jgi:hypothetical protein